MPLDRIGLFAATLALAACSSPKALSGCEANADCTPGEVCVAGACKKLCTKDDDCGAGNDCAAGLICTGSFCEPGCRSAAPQIDAIDADGSADGNSDDPRGSHAPHHVRSALTIRGARLDSTSVTLTGQSGSIALEVVTPGESELVARVPAGRVAEVTEGRYLLTVSNAAGSDQVELWLLQGEPGPPPSPAEIQAAVATMSNLEAATLGGRAASGYQRTDVWGRYFEAEAPPLSASVNVGAAVSDATASAGGARRALPGDASGRLYAVGSDELGELLALGASELQARLKVAANSSTSNIAQLRCLAVRNGAQSSVDVGAKMLRAADFAAAGVWQTFSLACDWAPDDAQQLVAVDFTNAVSEVSLDAVRVLPAGEETYFYEGALATATEWEADVIMNGSYARFCEALGKLPVRATTLVAHYNTGRSSGFFYDGYYYAGPRHCADDTFYSGNSDPTSWYGVWRYNGGCGCCVETTNWTYERRALITCR